MRWIIILLISVISVCGCGKRNTNIYVGETITKSSAGDENPALKNRRLKARDNPIKIQPQ